MSEWGGNEGTKDPTSECKVDAVQGQGLYLPPGTTARETDFFDEATIDHKWKGSFGAGVDALMLEAHRPDCF